MLLSDKKNTSNVPINISNLNTLGLKAYANAYFVLTNTSTDIALMNLAIKQYKKYLILGSGSNIVLPIYFNGIVIHNKLLGKVILARNANNILIKAMAGENWDEFVAFCMQHHAYGVENLSAIPGTVGAAPVQNIGAYQVEICEFIEYVEIYDLANQSFYSLEQKNCQFSYRNSMFRQNSNYIIIAVVFKLLTHPQLVLGYHGLPKDISSPLALRKYICNIRAKKIVSPAILGNVGSFFCNPLVQLEQLELLKMQYDIPYYAIGDLYKIPAGWLIERAGLKGYRMDMVGISMQHALILVNYARFTTIQSEVLKLAVFIQHTILQIFKITLTIEPIIVC